MTFDLSDRMAKGVNDNGEVVEGAIIEGQINGLSANKASGKWSHAEGYNTVTLGNASHAEGNYSIADGTGSHA